ncbi:MULTISPECIES: MogA/MoaB family molybdenum cofactor biosynthesis protein [Cyanophyceae]|uniref:Molybdenum cofactor biosynthesis protein B n=1 Tax=Leptolyngbya subtilissima DQ-A4 TaxID=2933933 RepID=A0ABV0K054_9CYAN|nr:MogA/MoaB family molybdenum cofactor biosynthesis protein [Nodosilinea sp. FACHB-141]MBD2112458.1 MogA/MoaB family molybdenum cofactor biosynthesis protein [Nodosilinea sp. FACHB-141]
MAHPPTLGRPVHCAVVTVSDTRTVESDRSGQLLQTLLAEAGHQVSDYRIVPDEPQKIRPLCQTLAAQVDCIILTGGTGIAPRDTTYDAIAALLEKTLPGFGEIFRHLSFREIGSRAMASRAVAGVYQSTLIFSLPGSSKAVTLAMETLILPELPHLVSLMQA